MGTEALMETETGRTMMWRRLDAPGHDVAALIATPSGPIVCGMATFRDQGSPCALRYQVTCDGRWHTTAASVDGWRGGRVVDLRIRTSDGSWFLNDRPCVSVAGCVDLDLSFTPATNLLPLRRLRLAVGAAAEVRSAWLAWPEADLAPLRQRYVRRSADTYAYEAELPDGGLFAATLRVSPDGWVLDYGDLWRADG